MLEGCIDPDVFAAETRREIKRRAGTRHAAQPDPPIHQLHQPGADRQPEAGAAKAPRGRDIGLREALENFLLLFRRYADTGIADGKTQKYRTVGGLLDIDRQRHLAVFGELDRIAEQVDHHLPQTGRIADDTPRHFRTNVGNQFQTFLVRAHRQHTHRLLQHIAQLEGQGFELHLAGLDLRKVENVIDDGQQRLGRGLHGLQVVPLLVVELGIQRQLGHADDAVHRRADFVAHVGQEGAARLVGRLCLLLGRNQFGFSGLDPGDVALQDQHPCRLALRIAGSDGPAQQEPLPATIPRLEATTHLKITVFAGRLSSDLRLELPQVIRMKQALPLGNGVIEIVQAVAQHLFPVPPRLDSPGFQIPVGKGIAGKQALPVIQSDVGVVRGIDQPKQFLDAVSQRAGLPGPGSRQQLTQLRLAFATKNFLQLTGEQPGFHET